jgi:hypothetical protein
MTHDVQRSAGTGPVRLVSLRADQGSVTVFVAVAAVGLLALAGLVVDGAAKVRAVQRADRVAAEAARAAGQAVDLRSVLLGQEVQVDRRGALAAAASYLRSAQVEGAAQLVDGGSAIAVTTTTTAPTVFLGLIGIPTFTVRGGAEVVLVHSQTGVGP